MVSSEREARLELAGKFREAADHSSEQELRDALSRSYYCLYHAARVWVGRTEGGLGHDELRRQVERKDKELAATLRKLYRLREQADYDPQFVSRNYGADRESFRLAVNEALSMARTLYQRMLREIDPKLVE